MEPFSAASPVSILRQSLTLSNISELTEIDDTELEVAPEPPLLEADFSPVNQLRRSEGSWIGYPKGGPAGRICCAICSGASRVAGQQSYGMEPEIDRPAFAGDLDG